MHVTEVVKEIARRWKLLNPEEKQPYKELAKEDKKRYQAEMRQLSTTDGLNPPKKPLTPYMLFVKKYRPIVAR